MSKTEETISALKASVGSYFLGKMVRTPLYPIELHDGYYACLEICGDGTIMKVHEGRILTQHNTVLTLEEAKTILKVYATAWERAHPEGAMTDQFSAKGSESVIDYGGESVRIQVSNRSGGGFRLQFSGRLLASSQDAKDAWFVNYQSTTEAVSKARSILHDHLKKQLNP